MTTTEKLARYETAQETLGMMAALRTRLIYEEEQKPSPNADMMIQWEKERARFNDEDYALLINDNSEIERILKVYGPQVKASFVAA